MMPWVMNSWHVMESCTLQLQLHARKPFQLQTLSVETPPPSPTPSMLRSPAALTTTPTPTTAGDALDLTCQSIAIKCISKPKVLRCGFSTNVCHEIVAMRRLHHPHVIHLDEVLACRSKIYFVLEFAKGGELLSRGANRSRLPEDAFQPPRAPPSGHRRRPATLAAPATGSPPIPSRCLPTGKKQSKEKKRKKMKKRKRKRKEEKKNQRILFLPF